jgi:hypothetical protein
MCFQAFGAPSEACNLMLTAIQEMKFLLRTVFGDSKEAVGDKINLETQGFMQDNGATPAGWAVVSISIIHTHKKEGHSATLLCPISKFSHKVAGILYVDDTDIIHLDLSREESLEDAHHALQASLARFKILEKFRSKFRFWASFRDFWSRSCRNHFLGIDFSGL